MAFISSSSYGTSAYSGNYPPAPTKWVSASAAPPVASAGLTAQQIMPYLQSALSALTQMEEGWASFSGSPAPSPAPPPQSIPEKPADAKEEEKSQSSGKSAKGNGLFGSGLMSGIFGAGSPMLNLVHGILDPIPVVGDIANMICGVVSPGYHQAHEKEQAQKADPPAASVAVAYSSDSSAGSDSSSSSSYQ